MQVIQKYGIILGMEENYYVNQINLINDRIKNELWDEAYALVVEELSMPYVPKQFYDQLKRIESEIKANFKLNQKVNLIQDEEELKSLLKLDEMAQLKALDQMSRLNLRQYDTLIQDTFNLLDDRLMKNLLIRICIEQQLTNEFNFSADGVTYTFIPASLCLPEDSDGVEESIKLLSLWLEQNPSLLNLCVEKVHYEALMALPISYSEDEAYELAYSILEETFLQISDLSEWELFKKNHDLGYISISTH
jgi:hypothetical protein